MPLCCEQEIHTWSLAEHWAKGRSTISGSHHYYGGKAYFCQECSQKRSIHQRQRLPLLSTSNQSKQSNGDKPRVITHPKGSGVPLKESKNQPESNKPIHTNQSCLFAAALGTFPCNLVWQAALAQCPASTQNLHGPEIIWQFFFSLGGQLWCRKEPLIHVLSTYASLLHFLSHLETEWLLDNNSTTLMAQSLASTDSRANLLPGTVSVLELGLLVADILIFPTQTGLKFLLYITCLERGCSFRHQVSPFYHWMLFTISHTHCCFSPGGYPPALEISFFFLPWDWKAIGKALVSFPNLIGLALFVPTFSILHFDHLSLLENSPSLSWLPDTLPTLLTPKFIPVDSPSSVHLLVGTFWSFFLQSPSLSIVLLLENKYHSCRPQF